MKRTFIGAVLLTCAAAPAMAADYYYYYFPTPTATAGAAAGYIYEDPNTILAVQQRLLARGYTVPIDGVLDYYTADALKAFQDLQGFPPTGVIDQPTLTVLGIKGMPAIFRR